MKAVKGWEGNYVQSKTQPSSAEKNANRTNREYG